jgi:hypothetical protein
MTLNEEKAFNLGKALRLAFELGVTYAIVNRKPSIGADDQIDDPEFRTARNGVVFAIDPKTGATSGLGEKIDNATSLKKLYGNEFIGKTLQGQKAVELLRLKQRGHVKAAFHKEGIGDIDLIWGDEKSGLKHIIESRVKNHQSVNDVLNNLGEVIEKGVLFEKGDPREKVNFYIQHKIKDKRYIIVVTKTDIKGPAGNKTHYVLTGMEVYKRNAGVKKNRQIRKA